MQEMQEMRINRKKHPRLPLARDHSTEEALRMIVATLPSRGLDKKSLVVHCLRVAFLLEELGYSRTIVIAGLLHGLADERAAVKNDLKEKFGQRVADLVNALRYYAPERTRKYSFEEVCENCERQGRSASIIKAADIVDNLRSSQSLTKDRRANFCKDISVFQARLGHLLTREPIYRLLLNATKELRRGSISKR